MWKALDLVTIPVKGVLVIAIYNDQGWQTALWKRFKRRYVLSGAASRKFLEILSFAAIWGGSLLYYSSRLQPWTTFSKWRNYNRNRGMSPWTDVVDWAGGYPFEAATPEQVVAFYEQRHLTLQFSKLTKRNGCNEFVFLKRQEDAPEATHQSSTAGHLTESAQRLDCRLQAVVDSIVPDL